MWGRNRASMVFFLKVLLQWSTKAESSIVTTVTSSNQVLMVVSDSSPLRRLSTLSHRSFMEFKRKAPLSAGGVSVLPR